MAVLQVRNFPDDLYETLRERAKKEHRSITQQAIVSLRTDLAAEQNQIEKYRQQRIKALELTMAADVPESAKDFDIVASIREDRAR